MLKLTLSYTSVEIPVLNLPVYLNRQVYKTYAGDRQKEQGDSYRSIGTRYDIDNVVENYVGDQT